MALKELLELSDAGVWGDEDLEDGISVLRSTNFRSDGRLDFTNLSFRRVEEPKRSQKTLLDGDILLEKSGGGPKQPVGRVCLFRGHETPHAFGNFLSRLRPRREFIDPQYLFYRLWQFHAVGLTTSYQKQTSGIRNLETKRYLELPIAVPPLTEQRRIVDLLSRAENIVRMRKVAEAKAKEIIPALFLDMFGDPARNPKGGQSPDSSRAVGHRGPVEPAHAWTSYRRSWTYRPLGPVNTN
jgi:type I restriction enzyme S subunit